MKKPITNPDAERIFKACGSGFIKFIDPVSDKIFIISVKEYKPRVKKIKKQTFKPDII